MVGSRRQGWALFAAMLILLVVGVGVVYAAEQHGSPAQHAAGVTATPTASTGGNMEGKEQRFGIAASARWAAVTTVDLQRLRQLGPRLATGHRRRGPVVNM